MKVIKVAILIFGLLGVSTALVPYDGAVVFSGLVKAPVQLLKFAGVFVVPVIMAGILLARRPAPMWPAVLALAGFSFGFVQNKLWVVIPHIADGIKLTGLVTLIAILGGMVASVIAVVKPDATA